MQVLIMFIKANRILKRKKCLWFMLYIFIEISLVVRIFLVSFFLMDCKKFVHSIFLMRDE